MLTALADVPVPAVFACSAGKDRTGLAVDLLLECLGVQREAIAADYERSTTMLESELSRWMNLWSGIGRTREEIVSLYFTADPSTLFELLREVDPRGGTLAELQRRGLSAEVVRRLRDRYVA